MDAVRRRLRAAAGRFAGLLRDAQQPARVMPRSTWSPADAATHVVIIQRTFAALAAGGSSPYTRHEEFGRISAELIAAEPRRTPAEIADAVLESTDTWLRVAAQQAPDATFSWHGIVDITYADASGILLGEH